MRLLGPTVTACAALLLLSSCAPSTSPSSQASPQPTPTATQPAFLAQTQSDSDRLPDDAADRVNIDPDSSRFQGDWDAHEVFLAIKDADSVCLVTGIRGQAQSWTSGCGAGNGVVTAEFPDGGVVKYLPIVTTAAPQGWTRLSDFVFAM